MGKMQNIEEVQTDDITDDSANDNLNIKDIKYAETKCFAHTVEASFSIWFTKNASNYRFPDRNDLLPSIHVDDIPTPPPDQFI